MSADFLRRICFVTVAVFPLSRLSTAWAVDDGDRRAGREAITSQIEAFKRDDGAAAYGQAAPSIQQIFPSQDGFMEMVRQGYRPVYRPRTYEFGATREEGDGFEQALRIQDAEGVDWDAVYTLQKQPDGSWKISGCRLVKRPGESV